MSLYGTNKFKAFYGNQKVKAIMYGTQKVWSGATEITYKDGDRVIGIQEFEEGQDVLHPDLDMTKSGYTHVGWALIKDSESIIAELLAPAEPITVYAVYLPNTLVVAKGDVGTVWYTPQTKDERYISGSIGSEKRVTSGNDYVSCTFTVNAGLYQTVSGTTGVNGSGSGWHQNDVTPSITKAGTYTVSSIFVGNNGTYTCVVGVRQITLSNPKAWV